MKKNEIKENVIQERLMCVYKFNHTTDGSFIVLSDYPSGEKTRPSGTTILTSYLFLLLLLRVAGNEALPAGGVQSVLLNRAQ